MRQHSNDNQLMPPREVVTTKKPFFWSVIVHLILVLALALGVAWRRNTTIPSVQAELWSSLPKESAPKPTFSPPFTPIPTPIPTPTHPTPSEPQAQSPSQLPHPTPSEQANDADINLKKQKQAQKLKQAQEDQVIEKAKEQKLLAQKQDEKKQKEALAKKKAQQLQAQEEQRQEEEKEEVKKQAQLLAQKQAEEKKKQQALTKSLENDRTQYLKNLQNQANQFVGTSSNQQGSASKASGPSANYAGMVIARVRPNIVYPIHETRKLVAHVEVWCLPSGKIISRKIVQSSGSATWDNAVTTALDKTAILPKDTNGTIPSPMLISFTNIN